MNNGQWLTVKEAADMSGYHPEHIRRLVREGKIEARKIVTVWLVNRSSLQNYLDEQKRDT